MQEADRLTHQKTGPVEAEREPCQSFGDEPCPFRATIEVVYDAMTFHVCEDHARLLVARGAKSTHQAMTAQ